MACSGPIVTDQMPVDPFVIVYGMPVGAFSYMLWNSSVTWLACGPVMQKVTLLSAFTVGPLQVVGAGTPVSTGGLVGVVL